ncbi:hypothetical protein [Neobacillus niacini]|uniref:hypothetical protein n=1 Tax=Neobacillus niacini TaxID=86668 RepID=UPI002FFF57D0
MSRSTFKCDSLGRADDGYELRILRAFRDNLLVKQDDGKEYYRIAPVLVNRIHTKVDRNAIYSRIWKDYLKECLLAIQNGNYRRCKEIYCRMVEDLKFRYL